MYEYTMSKERHDLLAKLACSLPENFYLAGGTALALQLGHRWSEDLDFFSEHKFEIVSYQPILIYKSLGYFEDADKEITPKMFDGVSWEEIKSYFLQRQKELLK
ncbi:MAG: nucleotidyl transferase AbiEii/AbiGii toxin family protein [Alkaliphilus sp.]|nr:nucleotidyl transferase AbiEii/AbiGii toxin family protein [Alkaliphilus sp.]